ncbi:PREDICTED: protein polybromo-1-like, partial [Priapulus caudatus]|uniref:Protein polybromo-1-like n=1 Tax=Priapulus caudatus TaxID=37621 RepID=A0ABM1ECE7_PRICU
MFVNNNPLFERHMSGTMPKRRRSVASFGRDDVSDASGTSTTKRRRVPQQDPNDVCQELFDIIRNYKDESGRIICETFIRAPNRRNAPDYHDVVSSPMDFMRMQQKLKLQEYTDVEQMTNDIELMLSNAKSYHKEDTQEYADACALWDLYLDFKKDVTEADDGDLGQAYEEEGSEMTDPERLSFKGELDETTCSSVASGAAATDFAGGTSHGQEKQKLSVQEIDQQLEELFSAAYNLQDSAGREVSIVFRILPSRRVYPEYYDIIDNPIDLKTIGQRVQEGRYRSLEEIEKDLLQMVKNAKMFNKPGSQIYKDAMVIKKTIVSKKAELQVRSHLSKSSERIRSRRHGNIRGMSAVAATLQYPEDEEDAEQDEDEDQCDDMDDDDNDEGRDEENELLQLQLYEAVRNYTNINNEILSEPFYKLPSKRLYPDYYEEIKHPECLHNIHRKIKKGAFGSVEEVMDEINVVFENAKQYNEPGSGIYRVALKLQKMLEKKRRDVLGKDGKRNEPDTSEDETGLLLAPSDARRKERLSISIRLADLKEEPTEEEEEEESQHPHQQQQQQGGGSGGGGGGVEWQSEDISALVIPEQGGLTRCPECDFRSTYKFNVTRHLRKVHKLGVVRQRETESEEDGHKKRAKQAKRGADGPHNLKKNLKALYNTVMDYQDDTGRYPVGIFIVLPSRKDYPDYYQIITDPIDMKMIEANINSGKYAIEAAMVSHFKLMFSNARHYNEEGSQVYRDADLLDRVLADKLKELGINAESPRVSRMNRKMKMKSAAGITDKIFAILEHIKEFTDAKGRVLSSIFFRLPSKQEMPEYYEIIKKPVDLARIEQRTLAGLYDTLSDFFTDFVLMS